jgi:hypothetical protein
MEASDRLNMLIKNNKIRTFDKNVKMEENEEGAFIESIYDSVNNDEFVIISKIFLISLIPYQYYLLFI